MTTSRGKFDLKEAIGVSGEMMTLGVSKVSGSVLAAQRFGGEHFSEMGDLAIETGAYPSRLLKVEDAQVASSALAGVVQPVTTLIGQGDMCHVYHPYTEKIAGRETIIPKRHNVDYGIPVEVMVTQGRGKTIEAGYANMCTPEHVSMMTTEKAAALLYIRSHHAVQKSMLTVAETVEVAKAHRLSLIVNAAAEKDLFKYSEMGIDLVVYSGAKAIEGPSAGLVIGKKKYIQWIRLQSKGIDRTTKIGKDNTSGFTQALEDCLKSGNEPGDSMEQRLAPFANVINRLPDLSAKIVQDGADRDTYQASVAINGGRSAKRVTQELKAQSPTVYTQEYQASSGVAGFDVRSVGQNEAEKITKRLREIMQEVFKPSIIPSYYKNRVCLNVLAHPIENTKACYEAVEGHVVLGVLSKNYASDEAAIEDMKRYQNATNDALSVGLGAGDPSQSQMVSCSSGVLQPQHVNQVFTGAGTSCALLGQNDTIINGLVSPAGKIGYVNIATGPLSSQVSTTEAPIKIAIQMLRDIGGTSIKYFPMKGLVHREESKTVVEVCAKYEFYLEPTGGTGLSNFEEILKIAIDTGVEKVIPHVYSPVIDKETGDTHTGDIKILLSIVEKIIH